MRTLSDRFLIKSMKSNRSLKVRIQVEHFSNNWNLGKNEARNFTF